MRSWGCVNVPRRRWARVIAALSVFCSACVPVNPSAQELVGRWKVDWECGIEVLELKADGTYAHSVEFAAGGRADDSGTWRVEPKGERLVGAKLILIQALQQCSEFGEKWRLAIRFDREMEAEWEWGRLVLHFNPDTQGFARE